MGLTKSDVANLAMPPTWTSLRSCEIRSDSQFSVENWRSAAKENPDLTAEPVPTPSDLTYSGRDLPFVSGANQIVTIPTRYTSVINPPIFA